MKISLLKRREDFDAILTASFSTFLREYCDWNGSLTKRKTAGLSFRQNARLNIVYPAGLSHREIAPFTREFRYAKTPFRRVLQTIYVMFSTRWPWEIYASKRAFTVMAPPAFLQKCVLLPGNHTMRIIDTEKNLSIVLPKAGFDKRFFIEDAKVRQRFPSLPAPQIIEMPAHQSWFVEERVSGLPLNRVANLARRKAAVSEAKAGLTALRSASERTVDARTWAAGLNREISELACKMSNELSPEIKAQISGIQTNALRILQDFGTKSIPVCQSHGDFQPANILVRATQIYLIDWEYSAERIAQYDEMVFESECRHPSGLCLRLQMMLENGPWDAALLMIFLLEDLALKLAENAAPAIFEKGMFLGPWLGEVSRFLADMPAAKASR